MKKKILTTTLAAVIGLGVLTTAYADWEQRGGGYRNNNMQAANVQAPGQRGGGYRNNNMQAPYMQSPEPRMQRQYNQVDPAVREKLDKFFTDTLDTRKEIVIKQAEQMALVRSDNPDPGAVGKLAGDLFDLRTTLRQKAEEAGVTAYLGAGDGQGFGQGNQGIRGGMNRGGCYMDNIQGGFGPRGNTQGGFGPRGNWN